MNKNNNNNSRSKRRDRQRERRRNDRGPNNNYRRNNNNQSERRERHFQKFVDTNHNKESNCWSQNDWNYDNNRNNNYHGNGASTGSGIFHWIRENPVKPLIIPKHINFEQQYDKEYLRESTSNKEIQMQIGQEQVIKSVSQESDKEKTVSKSRNNSGSAAYPIAAIQTIQLPVEKHNTIKFEQEKDMKLNLKQERKSSSSSSSSSESSSSEEEHTLKKETVAVKPEVKSSQPPSSPLNIKLKPNTTSVNSTPIKTTKNLRENPESSSTSSSSDEESTPSAPAPLKPVAEDDIKEKLQMKKELKSESTKNKTNSEDDVVCIGHLESKIVLEDESNEEVEAEKTLNKKCKKSLKKASEKCMICDKKGHTSFQCQMICKNCSAPYHGYRTCPQPANLNTMLQIFLEFCMQQFQNFNIDKQIAKISCGNVSKSQVNSLHLTSVNNKSHKLKRKHIKANESNTKIKASSKKRKVSTSKKKSKIDSDDSTDNDNEEDDIDSEKSSTESEDASDSSAESLVSYKRRSKLKSKNASKAALNLSNYSTNPVNLPIVLNGFPNLTVPTATVQNPTTSTNSLNLNTLLLTQMFQNAIGSLKK